ncbi:MAG: carotenoid oxygenase family protein [Cellvibrionaceae bacterium]
MDRRHFLQVASGLSLGGLSLSSTALAYEKLLADDPMRQAKVDFDAALIKNPGLIGFSSVNRNFPPQELILEGHLPKDLQGHFYRNGPAIHERGQQRYQHLFEGDGMAQQFTLANNTITHQGKLIRTPKFIEEEQAQRFLYSGTDSQLQKSKPIDNPDTINTANTSLLDVQNEMWALWEGGSPVAIDKQTLETRGLVNLGEGSRFGNTLKGLAFSAHPRIDANGNIWNFGLSLDGQIVVYQLNSKGTVKNVGLIDVNYQGRFIHDFLVTTKHILLILPSLTSDRNIEGLFSSIRFDAKQAMEVLLIDKQTLNMKKRYQLDAGFVFHYGNAWEDKQGTIRFDACLYPNANSLHQFSELMSGNTLEDNSSPSVLFQLNPDGTSSRQILVNSNSEFPIVDPQYSGLRNRYLYTLGTTGSELWFDTLRQLDIESGKFVEYTYGSDYLVEEHLFVNPSNQSDKGYLIGTALHVPSKRTCVNVFAESNIVAGPICRAWLPYHLPIGFHGKFITS